jgi:hypothetical protein
MPDEFPNPPLPAIWGHTRFGVNPIWGHRFGVTIWGHTIWGQVGQSAKLANPSRLQFFVRLIPLSRPIVFEATLFRWPVHSASNSQAHSTMSQHVGTVVPVSMLTTTIELFGSIFWPWSAHGFASRYMLTA